MNIDAEAAFLRQQYEHRKITWKELRRGLDHLDTLAVLVDLEEKGIE